MELEEFINKTLTSIAKGMKLANQSIKTDDHRPHFMIEPASSCEDRSKGCIEFDLAVTTSKKTGKKGEGGLKILALGLGLGKNSSIQDETISRIKFKIAPNITIS